jgi:hypothetical protein
MSVDSLVSPLDYDCGGVGGIQNREVDGREKVEMVVLDWVWSRGWYCGGTSETWSSTIFFEIVRVVVLFENSVAFSSTIL